MQVGAASRPPFNFEGLRLAHFFTADTHFADDPVRRFFDRPFTSIAAMDAAIVDRARMVRADDDLWILGDFAACETDAGRMAAQAAFDALPGRKHLVRGNHDPEWLVQALPWTSIHDLVEISIGERRFVLCHYPLVTWNNARSGTIQLFGHVHNRWRGGEGQLNVGVDQWDFTPITADQAELEALILPQSPLHQIVEGIETTVE